MARNLKVKNVVEASNLTDTILEKNFVDLIDERFTNYAFAVMEDRALPDARDGMKPSQRRTLVAIVTKKESNSFSLQTQEIH